MEDRRIHDNQITAKSWLYFDKRDSRYYRPYFARLNYNELSGGWCSADFAKHPGQYIEVDLLDNTLVTAIATQGRHGGQEWVQSFQIEYQRNNESSFRKYEEKGTLKVSPLALNCSIHVLQRVLSRYFTLHVLEKIEKSFKPHALCFS